MLTEIKQTPSRNKIMVGYNCVTQEIVELPFRCMRKPPLPKGKFPPGDYFCFVSNPRLVTTSGVSPFMWLHCYRDDSVIPDQMPKYLFPESDFVDVCHTPVSNRNKTKFDYFCFTLSGQKGVIYKGLNLFLKDIVVLNKLGLRGVVICYNKTKFLTRKEKSILDSSNVQLTSGRMTRQQVVGTMAKSKFGIFPNMADCSPRMIPECFLNNRPAIVNEKILGGWHYFEDDRFGQTYEAGNKVSLLDAVAKVTTLPFNQREVWEEKYGFNVSTRKLTELLKQHYDDELLQSCTHVYFAEYKNVFINHPEIFS